MVVCHCLALSDRVISDIAGAERRTIAEVITACGAGSKCGGCHELIEEMLDAARSQVVRPEVAIPLGSA